MLNINCSKKYECDYIVIVHRALFNGMPKKGGIDIINEYLLGIDKKIIFIEFPLVITSNNFVRVTKLHKNRLDVVYQGKLYSAKSVISWIHEIIFTIMFIRKYIIGKPYCIAADPLCGLSLTILIKLKSINNLYLHLVDYSEKRFKSNVLNYVYRTLLRITVRNAKRVGVVNPRVKNIISDNDMPPDKIIFIPNSPIREFLPFVHINNRQKYSIIHGTGSIVRRVRYDVILDLVVLLKKSFPELLVSLVGNVSEDPQYYQQIKDSIKDKKIELNVEFVGFMNKSDYLKKVASKTIGLAVYDVQNSEYMHYADPLKIREYAALGVPIIADTVTYTAKEAEFNGAGYCCESAEDMAEKIRLLWDDQQKYAESVENCQLWAKNNDKTKVLDELFYSIQN